ncbi:hypothetical protein [Pseudoalteromonas sp. A757]|uniref:hypothetical protein n=1 Tax=Pseudoalteromonas sp. A757 TaxID=2250709 RepID=UPI000FFEB5B8|nr:hypothetical protein [Pseudoalteromonas sp. A757]
MDNILCKFVFTFVLVAISYISDVQAASCSKWSKLDSGTDCAVSIINVLASPQDYEGKDIRLTGIAHFEFERNLLFIDKLSNKYSVFENSIELILSLEDQRPLEQLNGELVKVYGKFQKLNDGSYSLSEISHINSISSGSVALFDYSNGTAAVKVINRKENSWKNGSGKNGAE